MKKENENNPPRSRKPEYAPGRAFFFLFLLTSLGIHLFLFLLFRPLPRVIPVEKEDSKSHTILLLEDGENYQHLLRAYRLDYALRFLEPREAALPDLRSGFSSVLGERRSRALLPEIETALPGGEKTTKPESFALPERSLGELSRELSKPSFTPAARSGSGSKGPQLPNWKLGGAFTSGSWLVPDPAAEEIFHQYGALAKGPTLLRITRQGEFLPPAIEIYSSCQVPELDHLAVRQTALYIARTPSLSRKERFFCSVLWKIPNMKPVAEVHK